MMDILRTIFKQKSGLSENELDGLFKHWNYERSLKRKEFLSELGKTERFLYFVKKGTMRIYYVNDTEEICVGFAYANTLICSYPSFISNQPAQYYIEAITKSEVVGIGRTNFYEAIEADPRLERCWRLLTEEALLGKIEREVELLTFSPEERYQRLLNRSPHLFQLIPQKYIASYLRMKPETLSRIKKIK